MAELDKRIEGILKGRLEQIIKVWCAEFEKTGSDMDAVYDLRRERDTGAMRDITNMNMNKRRAGDKRMMIKEEKVCVELFLRARC